MEIDEWLDLARAGTLVDYDGHGHPVRDWLEDKTIEVLPSTELTNVPRDATHIAWYNR